MAPPRAGSRTDFTDGPVSGAYETVLTQLSMVVSGADQLAFNYTFDAPGRLSQISLRTRGSGTGTITAIKARKRTPSSNTLVATGDTQILSGDTGTVAAQAINEITPTSAVSLLAAQREFAKGDQLGVFVTADAGTANIVAVQISFYTKGHVVALAAKPNVFKND